MACCTTNFMTEYVNFQHPRNVMILGVGLEKL